MADLPSLTPDDVSALIPSANEIAVAGKGGQKLVFKGKIGESTYALKFAKLPSTSLDSEDFATSDIALRAKREVETMRDCSSPYMVKLGPVGLTFGSTQSQQLVFFSEEFIEGEDLAVVVKRTGKLSSSDVAKVGRQIAEAIKALWDIRKVHRDIKPSNIMRRESTGDFVLLDAGLAFDLDGESVSVSPVGTPAFFSPEQFEFSNRRNVLDFRSDMFSLGTTLYYLATGQHPFWSPGDTSAAIYSRITGEYPTPPKEIVPGFPEDLSEVIMRLLGKSAHLRYRKCDQLISALQNL